MSPSRWTRGATALLLAVLAVPLYLLAIWFNLAGPLGGSLQACLPGALWLSPLTLAIWLAALLGSVTLAIIGLVTDSGRGLSVTAIVVLIAMGPVLLIATFLKVFGDAGPAGVYLCPF
jgi:hypothetical protein